VTYGSRISESRRDDSQATLHQDCLAIPPRCIPGAAQASESIGVGSVWNWDHAGIPLRDLPTISPRAQEAPMTVRTMERWLNVVLLILLLLCLGSGVAHCQACVTAAQVTLSGNLRSANGLPAKNYTINFQPSQQGYIAGCGINLATPIQCATSIDGSVVLLPNPVTPTINTVGGAGAVTPGNYYIVYQWYDALGHVSLPSPESVITLSTITAITVNPPSSGVPSTAVGMQVFIGTTSGGETLQGSTVGTASYVLLFPPSGSTVPATTNNSICVVTANDAIWPTGTGYITSLTDSSGNSVPGYPMQWQLNGAGTTISLSNGLPYYHGVATFPAPVLAQPQNHGAQSINGPLTLGSYNFTAGGVGIFTNIPAYPIDVEGSTAGKINAAGGYLVNGSAGTSGQGLCSNGTALASFCTFLTTASLFYQTVDSNGTPQTQRPTLNFTSRFATSDSASPAQTTVDLGASGVSAGAYTCPNITFDSFGRATAAANGSCSPTFTGSSGYQLLPSGLILEWTTGGTCTTDCTETVSFPFTFPHACFSVQTTNDNISGTNITKGWGVNSACTTTGVLLQLQRRGDEGSFSAAPIVFAIGW
jgi:hypothetical protein